MKTPLPLPLLSASLALATAMAWAQPSTTASLGPEQMGARLAAQGANGVAPCASCHGPAGQGVSAAGFPRLAGQATEYLRRQLESYANDTRRNAVMQPIAKALSAEQRLAAATYYSRIEPPPASASASASAPRGPAATAGRRLAAVGDAQAGVQACANCHGPEGIGTGTYPYLAGQHGSYLIAALTEWKDGSRNNDPSGQMQRIAKALGDDQIQTVAAYFASLPAPSAAAKDRGTKLPALATVVSGPRVRGEGGQTPALGVGSEQGAPLSGGTQGVGGPGDPNGPSGAAAQGPASAPR